MTTDAAPSATSEAAPRAGSDATATTAPPAPRPTARWGADFDPDRLAPLELRMWKAYYRRQPARLFGTLVLGLREQAHVSTSGTGWASRRALAAERGRTT